MDTKMHKPGKKVVRPDGWTTIPEQLDTVVGPDGTTTTQYKQMFLGGLSHSSDGDSIKSCLSELGPVKGVNFPMFDGRGLGYAYVTCDADLAAKLIEGKHVVIDGQRVEVKEITKRVFLGGLPHYTDGDSIESCLSEWGTVYDVSFPVHPNGQKRGFAYVTCDADLADKLIDGKHVVIDGQRVEVKKYEKKGSSSTAPATAAPATAARVPDAFSQIHGTADSWESTISPGSATAGPSPVDTGSTYATAATSGPAPAGPVEPAATEDTGGAAGGSSIDWAELKDEDESATTGAGSTGSSAATAATGPAPAPAAAPAAEGNPYTNDDSIPSAVHHKVFYQNRQQKIEIRRLQEHNRFLEVQLERKRIELFESQERNSLLIRCLKVPEHGGQPQQYRSGPPGQHVQRRVNWGDGAF